MALAVSRLPLNAEVRVQNQANPRHICGAQSGILTGFSPNTAVFPYQYHSANAPNESSSS